MNFFLKNVMGIRKHFWLSETGMKFQRKKKKTCMADVLFKQFCRKMWPLVLNAPLSFVPGAVRCNSALCLLNTDFPILITLCQKYNYLNLLVDFAYIHK